MATPLPDKLNVAVVTGGHAYDVMNFHRLFRSLDGMDCFIQHLNDFASSPKAMRQAYDVVLFYFMPLEGPNDENLPWYVGKPKTALSELGETAQGIVILHHSILAYPKWATWSEMVGMSDRSFGYHGGQSLRVQITNSGHAITQGLKNWEMTDETYTMADACPGNQVLLSVEHPKSMKHIAWVRQHKNARVFNFQSGHDQTTWANPNFREVLRRGIRWAGHRL